MTNNLTEVIGNLWDNLTDLSHNEPEKYKAFMENASEEQTRIMSKPDPVACVEVFEARGGGRVFVNLLSWLRVTKAKADQDSLPLAGGSIDEDTQGGSKIANVATHPDYLEEYFNHGDPSLRDHFMQIVLDFMEHQNPKMHLQRIWSHVQIPGNFKGDSKSDIERQFSSFNSPPAQKIDSTLQSPQDLLQEMRSIGKDSPENPVSSVLDFPAKLQQQSQRPNRSTKQSNPGPGIVISSSGNPLPKVELQVVKSRKIHANEPLFAWKRLTDPEAIIYKMYLPGVEEVNQILSHVQDNRLTVQTRLGHALAHTLASGTSNTIFRLVTQELKPPVFTVLIKESHE